MSAGQERHLAVGDNSIFLGGRNDGELDRKRDDRDADPQDRMRDVALDAFLLDHQ
jgi:hypothetical protein